MVQINSVYMLSLCVIWQYLASKDVHTSMIFYNTASVAVNQLGEPQYNGGQVRLDKL